MVKKYWSKSSFWKKVFIVYLGIPLLLYLIFSVIFFISNIGVNEIKNCGDLANACSPLSYYLWISGLLFIGIVIGPFHALIFEPLELLNFSDNGPWILLTLFYYISLVAVIFWHYKKKKDKLIEKY